MNTFGERLKILQTELFPTQKEFAKALGISSGSLSDLIRSNTSPSAETIYSLCRILINNPNKLVWLLIGEKVDYNESTNDKSASFSTESSQLISVFEQLTEINRIKVLERSETLLSEQISSQKKKLKSSNSVKCNEEAVINETA